MPFAAEWLYRVLGKRYFWAFYVFEALSAYLTSLGTLALFAMYTDPSVGQFWRGFVITAIAVTVGLLWALLRTRGLARPLIDWLRNGKPASDALLAWRTAASLPRDYVVFNGLKPFLIVGIPISVFLTLDFHLPFYSAVIIFAGTCLAIAYAAILHFFASELVMRPVLRDASSKLPPDFPGERVGVPLRWKLLGALPLINVITGVVVSGLSNRGADSLTDLGIDVVIAVVVAFSVSLELTVLLTKAIYAPVGDLLAATERVKRGDLSARVPVLSGDELGTLAGSFNDMLSGLQERERLRTAFGSYVDPEVARRVVAEGELLEGEEVEVSVLFVDIRDFTPFAENASAREAVAYLNEFFGLVVPIIARHGGHANKFVGDGVLGVFGTPERQSDHADRALEAACELASAVGQRYGSELAIGVGVNSGPVLAGTIGGGGRLEFTVIGDPVNVAARVERATRDTGDVVLITEATRCLLSRSDVDLAERGAMPLKGKSEGVALWAPRVGAPAEAQALSEHA
jgi:class 3 adenylate cyclase